MWVEKRRRRVIQKLSTLDSDSDARNLIFFVPKLGHLFVEALQLLREFLGRNHGGMWVSLSCLGLHGILSVLSLAHSNRLVDLLALSTEIIADVLAVSQSLEHREDLQLLALP